MKTPDELIRDYVAEYRRCRETEKRLSKPKAKAAYRSMADRARGALDALFNLHPNSPAWAETGWTV